MIGKDHTDRRGCPEEVHLRVDSGALDRPVGCRVVGVDEEIEVDEALADLDRRWRPGSAVVQTVVNPDDQLRRRPGDTVVARGAVGDVVPRRVTVRDGGAASEIHQIHEPRGGATGRVRDRDHRGIVEMISGRVDDRGRCRPIPQVRGRGMVDAIVSVLVAIGAVLPTAAPHVEQAWLCRVLKDRGAVELATPILLRVDHGGLQHRILACDGIARHREETRHPNRDQKSLGWAGWRYELVTRSDRHGPECRTES